MNTLTRILRKPSSLYSLYWKAKSKRQDSYLRRKYANRIPKIYYDEKYACYIHPQLLSEPGGDASYVCCELVRDGCCYGFCLSGERDHEHGIGSVMLTAYNHAEEFSLLPEHEQCYGEQDLSAIMKLVERGKADRQQWRERMNDAEVDM